ncbi:MAG: hypothetical protein V3T53_09910 [Phycisphaerales bacterium]
MFRERAVGELIHWTPGGGTKIEWIRKISEITPGSSVGLETDEGDLVKINVTRNEMWDFAGSIVDIQPNSPRSERIAVLQVGDEVTFGEPNLIFVFSVPKKSIS